jgi:hypothetical protein
VIRTAPAPLIAPADPAAADRGRTLDLPLSRPQVHETRPEDIRAKPAPDDSHHTPGEDSKSG